MSPQAGLYTKGDADAAIAVHAADVNAHHTELGALEFIIDGGGSAIETGEQGHLEVPFACTIERVTLEADQSGSIKVDIWKDTYANFPPDNNDSICASAEPEISTAQKYEDETLTGWTVALAKGDIIAVNVDSCTTITRCTVSLRVVKS